MTEIDPLNAFYLQDPFLILFVIRGFAGAPLEYSTLDVISVPCIHYGAKRSRAYANSTTHPPVR